MGAREGVLELGPADRRHGVIVTCRHPAGAPLLTFHEPGRLEDAVTAACNRIDSYGGEWRIVAMSTPRSIYRDLQGPRDERQTVRRALTDTTEPHDLRDNERRLLTRAGRLELLEALPFRQNPGAGSRLLPVGDKRRPSTGSDESNR